MIAVWGVLGVVALLGKALWQLTPRALEALRGPLEPWQVGVAAIWTAFMLYSEGYRGFQKMFSPRVVARAIHLAENPRWYYVLFAPVYTMALVHATRKRLIVSWVLLLGIVALVLLVAQLRQPWRGIVDLGVIAGLAWGTASILVIAARAAMGRAPEVDPEVPGR